MNIDLHTILFARVQPDAIIPSKRDEDAGYDLYCNFKDESIIIQPNTIALIPTGIAVAFNSDYVLIVKERSSTGAKGMAVRMGVIDSGYRGEIVIGINNTNNKPIVITKDKNYKNEDCIIHLYAKAIAQGVLIPIPSVKVKEVTYEELLTIKSERGTSLRGASEK